jgi:hypothetical protein
MRVMASWLYLLHAGFLLGWFSTLKMEMIVSSEMSVHIRTTRRYIPEDGNRESSVIESQTTGARTDQQPVAQLLKPQATK